MEIYLNLAFQDLSNDIQNVIIFKNFLVDFFMIGRSLKESENMYKLSLLISIQLVCRKVYQKAFFVTRIFQKEDNSFVISSH